VQKLATTDQQQRVIITKIKYMYFLSANHCTCTQQQQTATTCQGTCCICNQRFGLRIDSSQQIDSVLDSTYAWTETQKKQHGRYSKL